jgi:hypothetical protein
VKDPGASIYPALERVWRWPPVRYVGLTLLALSSGPATLWVKSRASVDDVAEHVKVQTVQPGKPPTFERLAALEERGFALEQRVRELERADIETRTQLVGFLAADAEPNRARKAASARAARDAFKSALDDGLKARDAWARVLQTEIPSR